jgi:hypothetical protein
MILMGANPLLRPLKEEGFKYLFWAQMALALLIAISGPKKVSIYRAKGKICSAWLQWEELLYRHLTL